MFQTKIRALVEKKMGLSADAIGTETVAKAVFWRMKICNISDEAAYIEHLRISEKEWDELIELLVIPETWFFRNKESFAFLARYVRVAWLKKHLKNDVLRILSLPCSTGEEPYSVAMTLMDTGLPRELGTERFHIKAIDISQKALNKARAGIYGKESFRGKNLSFRDRYFTPIANGKNNDSFQIHSDIRNILQFEKGNMMDENLLIGEKPFDIIFCRNLLIYLSESGRTRALKTVERLLSPDGILFVGHVERSFVCGAENGKIFSWIRHPGIFACRRSEKTDSASCFGTTEPKSAQKPVRKSDKPGITPSDISFQVRTAAKKASSESPAGILKSFTEVNQQILPVSRTDENKSEVVPPDTPVIQPVSLLDKAKRLADQGDLSEALGLCEKILNKNAFHIQAYFLTGLIYHAMDDEERAEAYFNRAVYLDPNHYEALSHLAFIMEHRGDKLRAEQLRQRAHRILSRESS